MKTLSLTILSLLLSLSLMAEDVKLKITYNGNGIDGHTVTVSVGGAKLGSGVTNSSGEVTISVSSLPTKNIDLAGEKSCEGAKKSWDVKGYLTLDGNNYAHLKMEEPIAEMVEASGGFMSEKMMVASYGLVCSGSSSSSSTSSSSGTSNGNDSDDRSEVSEDDGGNSSSTTTALMTRDEALANQKLMFENRIAMLDNKIEKNQNKISSGKYENEKKVKAEQDIEEMKIEKLIAQNDLDRVNLTIAKGMLNKAERTSFKEEEKKLKEDLKSLKSKHKSGVISSVKSGNEQNKGSNPDGAHEEAVRESILKEKEEYFPSDENETSTYQGVVVERNYEFVVSDEEVWKMSKSDLKKKRFSLKTDLTKRKLELKTSKAMMSSYEVEQYERDIKEIEDSIEKINEELSKR